LAKNINIVKRTFGFAVNAVKLADELSKKSSPAKTLSSQILRSGTSIGANIEEAQAAESRADFIHKYSVALKEAREIIYWLKLLEASNICSNSDLSILVNEADEISRIIAQIIINTRKKKNDAC